MKVTEQEIETLVDFLKVLADRNRLRILGMLSEKECSVGEIALALKVKEPSASWHLQQLKGLGLVEMRAEGTTRLYKLRQQGIHSFLKDLVKNADDKMVEDPNNSGFEQKILNAFFRKGKLLEFPTRPAKQVVILRALAEKFQIGVFYKELEVNAILKEVHPDCATLRRYLVDFRFMARKDSVYWRIDPDTSDSALAGGGVVYWRKEETEKEANEAG